MTKVPQLHWYHTCSKYIQSPAFGQLLRFVGTGNIYSCHAFVGRVSMCRTFSITTYRNSTSFSLQTPYICSTKNSSQSAQTQFHISRCSSTRRSIYRLNNASQTQGPIFMLKVNRCIQWPVSEIKQISKNVFILADGCTQEERVASINRIVVVSIQGSEVRSCSVSTSIVT